MAASSQCGHAATRATIGCVSVDAQSTASSASLPAADDGVIGSAGELAVASHAQAAPRSDPRERREWLRLLDAVLADEIRWAGALSCEELIALADRPLKGRASSETMQEWWEYGRRRGWLATHEDDRFHLTDTARADLQARRERLWQPNPFKWAEALSKSALPAGAIGAAGYAAGKAGVTALAILGLCLAFVLGFILAGLIMLWIDRPADRWAARRACDWLDGRRVPLSVAFRSEVHGGTVRLYVEPSPDQIMDGPCS